MTVVGCGGVGVYKWQVIGGECWEIVSVPSGLRLEGP